ncbi:MAG: hypothetical protein ACYC1L_18510 [Alphaproteobacteria bacterium]
MAKRGTSARKCSSQETALQARVRAWIAEDAAWGKAESKLDEEETKARQSVSVPDCIHVGLHLDPDRPEKWSRSMCVEEIEAHFEVNGNKQLRDERLQVRATVDAALDGIMEKNGLAKKRADIDAWEERRYAEFHAILKTPATCPADVLAKLILADEFGMWTSVKGGDVESDCVLAAMRDLRTIAGIPQPKRRRYHPEHITA